MRPTGWASAPIANPDSTALNASERRDAGRKRTPTAGLPGVAAEFSVDGL